MRIPEWNENYHSSHGALQESIHVFIENGFRKIHSTAFTILEYGFGTGLNAFLSVLESEKASTQITYIALEKHPINLFEVQQLNYTKLVSDSEDYFGKMHRSPWNTLCPISKNFKLKKIQTDFRDYQPEPVDLIYFDAFGFRVQPYLWDEKIFRNLYQSLSINGLFTTYSSKGDVRRKLENIGFEVEKIPGPKGKREMLNAWKR